MFEQSVPRSFGLFGQRSGAIGGNADGGSDEDPLLEPITTAAMIAHAGISDVMNPPTMMVRKSMFLSTMMAAKDIRQYRQIVIRKGIMTESEAEAARDKKTIFDKLMENCPFI